MDHALCFEKGWEDAGKAVSHRPDDAIWFSFCGLMGNLQKWCREHNPPSEQYSQEDVRRFWEAYKRGAYGR
jgi:hypothetical protein